MIKRLGVLLGVLLVLNIGPAVNAQSEVDLEFMSGVVTEVSSSSVTIIDSDSDEETQVIFKINSETTFEDIQSMSDVVIGDEIFIDYVSSDQENVSVNIYKVNSETDNFEEEYIDETDTYGEINDGEEE